MAVEKIAIALRPLTLDDAGQAADLGNRYEQHFTGVAPYTAEETRLYWEQDGMDLTTCTIGAFTPEGEMVGEVELWDHRSPYVTKLTWMAVDPGCLDAGVGEELVDWLIGRARERVALAPPDARVVLQMYMNERITWQRDLARAWGFDEIRRSYRMLIALNGNNRAPQVPAGLLIRAMQPGEERMTYAAVKESFRDHWGYIPEPFEAAFARWKGSLERDPSYDPALFFIALEGDEVAGMSLCYATTPEDPQMGWVATLGVRRPWRRRGLGLALLQHSFAALGERGCTRVGLGVDAYNLTGALQLYERAGMTVNQAYVLSQLVLREGQDLTTQSIEE
jgi:ribosomal protein S18 acetylase RimI-like enzyme